MCVYSCVNAVKYCGLDHQSSVGGVMVSIVAFQAIDPGSTPGQRSFFKPLFNF